MATLSAKSKNPNLPILVVDVGNTSTAIGVWTDGVVSHTLHIDGGLARNPSRTKAAIRRLGRNCRALAYLSVVPDADAAWEELAKTENLAFAKVTLKAFEKSGIKLNYPRPSTIGADRLADAAGAVDRYGAPVIVCDFGTAFTAAVITRDNVWQGGAIAPGFPLMRDYLFERTAKLPRLPLSSLKKCPKIGKSTKEAMIFGAIAGYRGMAHEIVSQLSRNFGGKFNLVATGGFAHVALDGAELDFTIDPTLTLHGAALLAKGILA